MYIILAIVEKVWNKIKSLYIGTTRYLIKVQYIFHKGYTNI